MAHDKADVKKSRTKLFFAGVFILTAANLVIKLSGLLFKVPMNYIVGDTGMGYYGSAYSIYTFLYMLSTAGLPVAVSIMVTESRQTGRREQVKRIFRTALFLFFLIGLAGSGAMLLFADELAVLIGAQRSVYCIIAIAPTLFFICISGAYRGYFQGYGQMLPIALSQLIEALGKLFLGIGAALYAIRMGFGIHVTAAYAVAGVTVGSLLGMLYLMAAKLFFKPDLYDELSAIDCRCCKSSASTGAILRRFAAISLPVTVSSSVMSLSGMIDTVLIQRMLQLSGMGQEEAVTLYGNYTSLAVPMFNLPPVLIYPITCALIPLLTSARASGDGKQTTTIVTSAIRVSVLIGVPCAFGMSALACPILRLFYQDASADVASPLLTLLAPSSLFVCLLAVTNAVLQATGRERKPVVSMLAGAAVKTVSGVILVRYFGMTGAPISTFLCYFTAAIMNFVFVLRDTKIRPAMAQMFMKPLVGGLGCGVAASVGYGMLSLRFSEAVSTGIAIGVGGAVYVGIILCTKAVDREDMAFLPEKFMPRRHFNKIKIRKHSRS